MIVTNFMAKKIPFVPQLRCLAHLNRASMVQMNKETHVSYKPKNCDHFISRLM